MVYLRIFKQFLSTPNASQPWNSKPIVGIDVSLGYQNRQNTLQTAIDLTEEIPLKKESNTIATAIVLWYLLKMFFLRLNSHKTCYAFEKKSMPNVENFAEYILQLVFSF